MRVLITGAGGQVGQALIRALPDDWTAIPADRSTLDIANSESVARAIAHHRPDLIVNSAAYTAVDRAESEPDLAYRTNREGAAVLAAAAAQDRIRFVHISTDFVFDGAVPVPYRPDDVTNPLNVYGASKLAGEQAVQQACPEAVIVRTAWVYGAKGANFLHTMLRLMRTKPEVRVVCDQVGGPTHVRTLAQALIDLARGSASGIHHYTQAGIASWYDFAAAIGEEATAAGLLDKAPLVRPIRSEAFPTPARRPSFSVLDTAHTYAALGQMPDHWRVQLRKAIAELKEDSLG